MQRVLTKRLRTRPHHNALRRMYHAQLLVLQQLGGSVHRVWPGLLAGGGDLDLRAGELRMWRHGGGVATSGGGAWWMGGGSLAPETTQPMLRA